MPTLKELMAGKTRGDGRKFRKFYPKACHESLWFEPIFLCNNFQWHGLDQDGSRLIFGEEDGCWTEWHSPKKTKKVKMYTPVRKAPTKGHFWAPSQSWNSRKDNFHDSLSDGEIVSWLEMEVEVPDED